LVAALVGERCFALIGTTSSKQTSATGLRSDLWSRLPLGPLSIALLAHIAIFAPLTVSIQGIFGLIILAVVPGWLLVDILFPNEHHLTERIPLAYAMGLSFMSMLTLGLHVLPGPLTPLLLLGVTDLFILGLTALYLRQPAIQRPTIALNQSFWLRWLPVIALVILASSLRLIELGYSEFQGDEARATLLAADVASGVDNILLVHQKAPGEVLLPAASYSLLGTLNEFNSRLPFSIAGITALLMAYGLARRMMEELPNGKQYAHTVGIIAMAILTVSGYLIAFGRLLQYQSVVLLCHLSAAWLCWRFYESGPVRNSKGVATIQPNLIVAAIISGVGLIAHYEGILIVPVLLLLFGLGVYRHRVAIKDAARMIGATAFMLLLVPACFYVPFVTSPSFAVTSEYVLRRVSKQGGVGILYNNVPFYINLTSFYETSYQVVTRTVLAISAFCVWLFAYVRPRWLAITLGVVLIIGAIFSYWLPWTLIFFTISINLVVFLVAPALIALLLAPKVPAPMRTTVLWFACTFIVAAYLVRKPGTHFYTSEPAFAFAAALLIGQLLVARWKSWQMPARAALVGFGATLLLVSSYYVSIVYVRNIPEYKRVFPAAQPSWHLTPYGNELPDGGYFGFPYRAGWKTIGYLYEQGLLSGTYDSNEEDLITGWYTRGAPRCTWMPEYYFVASQVQDVRWIPNDIIESSYAPISTISVGGNEKITIYQRDQGRVNQFVLPSDMQSEQAANKLMSIPEQLDGRGFEESYDRLTAPDMPTGPSLSPGLSMAVPGHAIDAPFLRNTRLHGYDVYSGVGSQTRYLSLYWSSAELLPPTWAVQLELFAEDGSPLPTPPTPCGDAAPMTWSSAVRRFVEVAYQIDDPRAATAIVSLIDTETGTPVALSNGTGSRVYINFK
jgi:hypothetical protein